MSARWWETFVPVDAAIIGFVEQAQSGSRDLAELAEDLR